MTEQTIPEMTISDNKVVLATTEVPIMINGEKQMIKFQKCPSGLRREVIKKYTNTKIVGNSVQGEIEDPLGVQADLLSKVIIDAPFDFTPKGIASLPDDVVDYLYSEYENWSKKKVN